jgi:hypothetical protein
MYSTLQMLDKLVAEAKEALAKSSDCFMFGLPDWKAIAQWQYLSGVVVELYPL